MHEVITIKPVTKNVSICNAANAIKDNIAFAEYFGEYQKTEINPNLLPTYVRISAANITFLACFFCWSVIKLNRHSCTHTVKLTIYKQDLASRV